MSERTDDFQTQSMPHDEIRKLLIEMRRYVIYHGVLLGECVAWNKLKSAFSVDEAFDENLELKRDEEKR